VRFFYGLTIFSLCWLPLTVIIKIINNKLYQLNYLISVEKWADLLNERLKMGKPTVLVHIKKNNLFFKRLWVKRVWGKLFFLQVCFLIFFQHFFTLPNSFYSVKRKKTEKTLLKKKQPFSFVP